MAVGRVALTDQRIAEVLARLQIDDRLLLMQHVPDDRREEIQNRLPRDKRDELKHAELYPPDSAGRSMNTNFLALDRKMSAQEAIDSIRAQGDSKETVLYLYVVDEEQRLLGVVPIRRLVAAPPSTPVNDLMTRESIHVAAEADQEDGAALQALVELLGLWWGAGAVSK